MHRCIVISLVAAWMLAGIAQAVDPDMLAITPHLAGDDPHWVQDPVSKCWIFERSPAPRLAIRWQGACNSGLATGEGTLTLYRNGMISVQQKGHFDLGSLNGHGITYLPHGESFEGEWSHGSRMGRGVLKRWNGDVYEGNWPGAGVYSRKDGVSCPAEVVRRDDSDSLQARCIIDIDLPPSTPGSQTPTQNVLNPGGPVISGTTR